MRTAEAEAVLVRLRAMSNEAGRRGMARFGIKVDRALGISVTALRGLARELPKDHDLAADLWDSGIHEARILASMVDEPHRVTAAQMDRWAEEFDSWDLCDQCCGNLFWRARSAHDRSLRWSGRRGEFVRRAGFALMATAAAKERDAPDERFLEYLPLIEQAADDDRNFVRKAVNWALRQIGKRNAVLYAAALGTARRLADRPSRSARWIASNALRELEGTAVRRRLGVL